MLKNKKQIDRDSFLFYNILQKLVHQHFSKRRNKKIFFKYQNVIPNVHFIIMDLMPNKEVTKFEKEFFLQILKIVMETKFTPILDTIYTWRC